MKAPAWSTEESAELYGIREWGHDYFDISKQGEVVVNLKDGKKTKPVSLASDREQRPARARHAAAAADPFRRSAALAHR
jgi:arginine decarboxylase-like protein